MLKLNIIGAGRAGGTVACALAKTGLVQIGQVLNRTFASARSAVAVLGEGVRAPDLRLQSWAKVRQSISCRIFPPRMLG
jgi:shikimate 5-dehydrogenase